MHVLVTGSTGFVGSHLVAGLTAGGARVTGAGRSAEPPVDLGAPGAAAALLEATRPDAVVNLAAVPDIAPARQHPDCARRLNVELPAELAQACRAAGTRLVHVSTDQVFDGGRGGWREGDPCRPRHVYGETKRAGELALAAAAPDAAILRPGLITGLAPAGRRSSTSGLLAALDRAAAGEGDPPAMFTDEWRSPVCVEDLVRALAELVGRDDLSGPFHCGGERVLTRRELALEEAARHGRDPSLVGSGTREAAGLADERPADLSLDSSRLVAALGWTPRALGDVPG